MSNQKLQQIDSRIQEIKQIVNDPITNTVEKQILGYLLQMSSEIRDITDKLQNVAEGIKL
jgi:flagellar hook-associated protein FlgK